VLINLPARVYTLLKRVLDHTLASNLSPIDVPAEPTYTSDDVTVVIPTINTGNRLAGTILKVAQNRPHEIIVVTVDKDRESIQRLLKETRDLLGGLAPLLTVGTVCAPSKRKQMALGTQLACTSIIVFADDDVVWPAGVLKYILACFEDPAVGGVGTLQNLAMPLFTEPQNLWQSLAADRLARRMVRVCANNYMDHGMTCLSGRTAAYRAEILQTEQFIHSFTHEYWMRRYLLDTGDDVFVTHWLYSRGWKIRLQKDARAAISTIENNTSDYIYQLLRWSRNSKRMQIRCLCRPWMLW
jgi:cellulose synthase/poly-beta-1,6-N-acetylglucosamine synthase-like glycosyltransferase